MAALRAPGRGGSSSSCSRRTATWPGLGPALPAGTRVALPELVADDTAPTDAVVGLTDFLPAFRVVVDGQDITGVLVKRLARVAVTDEAGVQSDACEIEVTDDPLNRVEVPPSGAELRVDMGYAGALRPMGLFVVDEVEIGGPPDRLRIRGMASPHGATAGGAQRDHGAAVPELARRDPRSGT